MPFVDNLCTFFCNGMIVSMLEPHLVAAGADTNDVGITFLVFGATFMVSTPLAGLVSNHNFDDQSNLNAIVMPSDTILGLFMP